MKIVVLDGQGVNPGDISWNRIEELGELTVYPRTAPEEVLQHVGDAEIALTNKTVFDANIIAQLKNTKYIGVLATGYNVVDTKVARERGIVVTNIPAYSTDSVAQMVFAHLLNVSNHVDTMLRRRATAYGAVVPTSATGTRRSSSLQARLSALSDSDISV